MTRLDIVRSPASRQLGAAVSSSEAGPNAAGDGAVGAVVLLSGLSAALLAQGAYYPPGQWFLGLALFAAGVVVLRAPVRAPRDALTLPIVASVGLASWALLRGSTEPSPLSGMRFALLGLAVATTLAVVRRLGPDRRALLTYGLFTVGGLVAVAGWAGVVWHLSPLALTNDGVWRAASTLTYANATAAVLGPLSLLLLGSMAARPRDARLAIVLTVLLVGTAATLSRAGILALIAGAVVLAFRCPVRRLAGAAVGPVLGAGVAILGLLPSMPITSVPGRPLAIVALVGGLAVAGWLSTRSRQGIARAALGLGGLAVAVVLLVGPHALQGALGDVATWRAHVSSPARVDAARAAVALAVDHPVVGVGPGDGWTSWRAADGTRATMRYVHNEYLQVLVDVGAPGLLLLLVVLVGAAAALRATARSRSGDGLVAGAAAALAAAEVHAAFDFVWHVPAVPLLLAAIVGIGFGSGTQLPVQTCTKGREHEINQQEEPDRRRRRAPRSGGGAGRAWLGRRGRAVIAAVLAGPDRADGHPAGTGGSGVGATHNHLPSRQLCLAGPQPHATGGQQERDWFAVHVPAVHRSGAGARAQRHGSAQQPDLQDRRGLRGGFHLRLQLCVRHVRGRQPDGDDTQVIETDAFYSAWRAEPRPGPLR